MKIFNPCFKGFRLGRAQQLSIQQFNTFYYKLNTTRTAVFKSKQSVRHHQEANKIYLATNLNSNELAKLKTKINRGQSTITSLRNNWFL